MKELERLNKQIIELTEKRDSVLKELRKKCQHLRLVEVNYSRLYSGAPPFRICADCGAEEEGWYCGYQVLALRSERTDIPDGVERAIIETTQSANIFYSYRKRGPLYMVGQSHPNFRGGGVKTYKQLTAV